MAVSSSIAKPIPAGIPANSVNLATYGGVPGATAANIRTAINDALNALAGMGGGTLVIDAGTYDLGTSPDSGHVIRTGLTNICIRGYGATFTCDTTTQKITSFFYFTNPQNVAVMGLSFQDRGYDRTLNWKGAYALDVSTSAASNGFKAIDIECISCLGVLRGSATSSAAYYTLTGLEVSGWATDCYYGVGCNFNGQGSKVTLICSNVRRSWIAYGAKDWKLDLSIYADATFSGSNGAIDPVALNAYPCENIDIRARFTGRVAAWFALVNFYAQETGSPLYKNIKANVTLDNTTGAAYIFFIRHEVTGTGILASSTVQLQNVECNGYVKGAFPGGSVLIEHATTSTAAGNSLRVSRAFRQYTSSSGWPAYCTFGTPAEMRARPLLTF